MLLLSLPPLGLYFATKGRTLCPAARALGHHAQTSIACFSQAPRCRREPRTGPGGGRPNLQCPTRQHTEAQKPTSSSEAARPCRSRGQEHNSLWQLAVYASSSVAAVRQPPPLNPERTQGSAFPTFGMRAKIDSSALLVGGVASEFETAKSFQIGQNVVGSHPMATRFRAFPVPNWLLGRRDYGLFYRGEWAVLPAGGLRAARRHYCGVHRAAR